MPLEFGTVGPPWYDTKPVALIGGGLSLKGFDFEQLRDRCHVIAVKGSIFDIPWADCGVGVDWPRYQEWRERFFPVSMPVYWAVDGLMLEIIDRQGAAPCLIFLQKLVGAGLSARRDAVYGGGTSGFAALNVAVLKQARRIYLFGYDYHTPTEDPDRGPHRHNDQHYIQQRHQRTVHLTAWAQFYTRIQPLLRMKNVFVFNCSNNSGITCFPMMTHEQAIEQIRLGKAA